MTYGLLLIIIGFVCLQLEAILQSLHILHCLKWKSRDDIVVRVEDALVFFYLTLHRDQLTRKPWYLIQDSGDFLP